MNVVTATPPQGATFSFGELKKYFLAQIYIQNPSYLPIPSILLLNISVNFSELYILSLETGTFKAKLEFATGFVVKQSRMTVV